MYITLNVIILLPGNKTSLNFFSSPCNKFLFVIGHMFDLCPAFIIFTICFIHLNTEKYYDK